VVLLACVLALDSADKGAIGAVAPQIEHALHTGNAGLGLLVTISSLLGAVATIPVGGLVDHRRRVRLLWISILIWAAAQLYSGLATSYDTLLAGRVALGVLAATAGPTVASLTGDLFPPRDRGRMYGFILTGEILGAGAGLLVAAFAAHLFGWRAAFLVLTVPSVAVALALRQFLPEPDRGGQSQADTPERGDDLVLKEVQAQGVEPAGGAVLSHNPEGLSFWRSIVYVLRVRTNVILIVSSSLGYFFMSGLRTFALLFLRGRYGLGEGGATTVVLVIGVGALVGLLVAGNAGDHLVRRGRVDGRILVAVIGFVAGTALLVPGLVSPFLLLSLVFYALAAGCIAAPNPGLDAARLDVMPAFMWGRAEGVRTFIRQCAEAFAPLLFGVVSEWLGGTSAGIGAGINNNHAVVTAAQARGLQLAFLVMLVPLLAGGLVLLAARRTYPADVAAAAESDRRVSGRRSASPATSTRQA
jgi:predicted MFS family arabinose efflux permease